MEGGGTCVRLDGVFVCDVSTRSEEAGKLLPIPLECFSKHGLKSQPGGAVILGEESGFLFKYK